MTTRILMADVIVGLRSLPAESIDCAMTSPPYWGLRDYGVAGQLGLEPTLGEHIEAMVAVFAEVWRALKPWGTLWLNYGDCYAAAPNGKSAAAYKAEGADDRTFRDKPFGTVGPVHGRTYYGAERGSRGVDRDAHDAFRAKAGAIYDPSGGYSGGGKRGGKHANAGDSRGTPHGRVVAGGYLKPKDLCMVSNRLAIALQDWGWWVRSEIVWHKPNPMPESVYDRPTTAHEKILLLTKSEEYYYDHAAIREPVTGTTKARVSQDVANQAGSTRANGGTRPDRPMRAIGASSRENVDRVPRSRKVPSGWDVEPGAHGHETRSNDRGRSTYGRHTLGGAIPDGERRSPKDELREGQGLRTAGSLGRGPGWRDPEPGPDGGKPKSRKSGAAWRDGDGIPRAPGVGPKASPPGRGIRSNSSFNAALTGIVDTRNSRNVWKIAPKAFRGAHFATFPPELVERCLRAGAPREVCGFCGRSDGCRMPLMCRAYGRRPGLVLDPFGGSGTVALVAESMGLDAVMIEVNPEYVEMSRLRLGLPADVVEDLLERAEPPADAPAQSKEAAE